MKLIQETVFQHPVFPSITVTCLLKKIIYEKNYGSYLSLLYGFGIQGTRPLKNKEHLPEKCDRAGNKEIISANICRRDILIEACI